MRGHCVRRYFAQEFTLAGIHVETKFGEDVAWTMIDSEEMLLVRREQCFVEYFLRTALIKIGLHQRTPLLDLGGLDIRTRNIRLVTKIEPCRRHLSQRC